MSCDHPEFEYAHNALTIDGAGCACVGVDEKGRAIYDYELLVLHFGDHEGMKTSPEEIEAFGEDEYMPAIEWIDYNIEGATCGYAMAGYLVFEIRDATECVCGAETVVSCVCYVSGDEDEE